MFRWLARKADETAISTVLGRVARNRTVDFELQGYSPGDAEQMASKATLESLRAAQVDIHSYEAVKQWAKNSGYY
jgi:hypothetical protein